MADSLGYAVEGQLTNDGGGWGVQLEDGTWVSLEKDVLPDWEGKKVRILIANLGILEQLVQMGMTAGNEQEFVNSLPSEVLDNLTGE